MERNSEEKSDKYRVNLGVWQQKFGRSFAIWQFGRTFGFPKDENSASRKTVVAIHDVIPFYVILRIGHSLSTRGDDRKLHSTFVPCSRYYHSI